MKTRYKYIHFEKTGLGLGILWECYNNRNRDMLGVIPEEKTWNQYVFEPQADCVFNNQCLRDIADFLDQIN